MTALRDEVDSRSITHINTFLHMNRKMKTLAAGIAATGVLSVSLILPLMASASEFGGRDNIGWAGNWNRGWGDNWNRGWGDDWNRGWGDDWNRGWGDDWNRGWGRHHCHHRW